MSSKKHLIHRLVEILEESTPEEIKTLLSVLKGDEIPPTVARPGCPGEPWFIYGCDEEVVKKNFPNDDTHPLPAWTHQFDSLAEAGRQLGLKPGSIETALMRHKQRGGDDAEFPVRGYILQRLRDC